MGDRANIAVKQEKFKDQDGNDVYVYLYSHWGGSDLPMILQSALKRGNDRWTDNPYLTRIIFSEMVKDDLMDTTGYGISNYICDNEHAIIYVDTDNQTITIGEASWSFKEYIELDKRTFASF